VRVAATGGRTTSERLDQRRRRRLGHLASGHGHSYKSFKDVSGDPEAQSKRQLAAAAGKSYADLRAPHCRASAAVSSSELGLGDQQGGAIADR